jgi:retron-type reverse transcriptase
MPHKLSNLWPQITEYDALLDAWREVRSGKGHKPVALRYESNLAVNLSRLETRLQDGSYQPRPHYEFWIKDPKPRLIQAPYLEDRIVQHAVCNALRVPLQERMIAHTYSCLIGRGTHACSRQLQHHLKNHKWRYYFSLDISKFFYNINHDSLYAELCRHIKCRRTLALLWQFITINGTERGIPIGASTSQIMANMALNPLDHFARRVLKLDTYLRYCDDMVALFETAAAAHAAMAAITDKVEQLGLQLNSKSGVGWVDDGIDWVGYRHWSSYKLIRKRALKRLKRRSAAGCTIESTMSFLSHAKETASLRHVASILWARNREQRPEIRAWLHRHRPQLSLTQIMALPVAKFVTKP